MKGSAYSLLLLLLFLASSSLVLSLSSYGILKTQSQALSMAKEKYTAEEEISKTILWEEEEEKGNFVIKKNFKINIGKFMLEMEKSVFAKGGVPLSFLPDLKLDEMPSSHDFLAFLGKFTVEEKDGYFYLQGRRKALYFPYSVAIELGEKLRINGRMFRKMPVIVDGNCIVRGRGEIFLLCAGRINLVGNGNLTLVSTGEGFLLRGTFRSQVNIYGKDLEGEILGEKIKFYGKGIFKGALQAEEASGNWIHIKKGILIKEFPEIYFLKYTFCYREKKELEAEK